MPTSADVVIIGGGILGTSLAYYLARKGAGDVVLLERASIADGSTGKSAAIVRMHYTNPVTVQLALRSRDLFLNWAERVGGPEVYTPCGWYFLAPNHQEDNVRRNVRMQRALGVDAEFVDAELLARRVRGLDPSGVNLVVHEPLSGYADPVATCVGLAGAAAQKGVRIVAGVNARRLLREGGRVTGVDTDGDTYTAPVTVLAAGPWAGGLASGVGLELPLENYREQELMFDPTSAGVRLDASISNMCDQIYLRPRPNGGMLVGRGYPKPYESVDPNAFNDRFDPEFAADVETRLARRFPALRGLRPKSGVVGLYTVTPDWHPIVGPADACPGLWLAVGGSGHSFKIGPAIGEMLADQIVAGECRWVDAEPFKLSRFASGAQFSSSYGGNRA